MAYFSGANLLASLQGGYRYTYKLGVARFPKTISTGGQPVFSFLTQRIITNPQIFNGKVISWLTPNYHGQKGGPKSPYGRLDRALGWNLETNCLRNPKNMAREIFYLLVVEQGLHTSGVKRFSVSPSVSSKWKKTLSEVVTLFSTKASSSVTR